MLEIKHAGGHFYKPAGLGIAFCKHLFIDKSLATI